MQNNLIGKKALVCGSTQGIGLAAAQALAGAGAEVILLGRNEDSLINALKTLTGTDHKYLLADQANSQGLESSINLYFKVYPSPVHILVNNSGGPNPGPITEAKTEEFLKTFEQHLIANHILAQAVIGGMKDAGYGRIINVISTSVKAPLANLGVSNTIRAAVANWAKTMANELGQFGITVNNVLPGATYTGRLQTIIENKATKLGKTNEQIEAEMLKEIPAKRFGKPEEVAAAIAFLASPAASYINGINLPVDGGRTASL